MKRAAVSLFEGARAGLLATVCLCLLVFGGMSGRGMAQNTPGTPGTQSINLTQAQFILSDSELPPPDSAPWQPLTLPDNWNLSRPGVGGFAWYRIEFTLSPGPQRLSALYAG